MVVAGASAPGRTVFEAVNDCGPAVDGFYPHPGIVFGVISPTVAYVGTRDIYATTITTA